jgi:hypothetical protein
MAISVPAPLLSLGDGVAVSTDSVATLLAKLAVAFGTTTAQLSVGLAQSHFQV